VFCRAAIKKENEPCAVAYEAPEDGGRSRWLHLTATKARERSAKRLDAQGSGLIRAISPPFFSAGVLSQEVKWVGYPDSVFEIKPFLTLVELFGADVPFLEWVTYWHDVMPPKYPKEMKKMVKFFTRLPVWFILCSHPALSGFHGMGSHSRRGSW